MENAKGKGKMENGNFQCNQMQCHNDLWPNLKMDDCFTRFGSWHPMETVKIAGILGAARACPRCLWPSPFI